MPILRTGTKMFFFKCIAGSDQDNLEETSLSIDYYILIQEISHYPALIINRCDMETSSEMYDQRVKDEPRFIGTC